MIGEMFKFSIFRLICTCVFICVIVAEKVSHENKAAYVGTDATMMCKHSVKIEQVSMVLWQVDTGDGGTYQDCLRYLPGKGTSFHNNSHLKGRVTADASTLTIHLTRLSDEHNYQCQVEEKLSLLSDIWRTTLSIYVHPQSTEIIGLTTPLLADTSVTLICRVNVVKPKPHIYWQIGAFGGNLIKGNELEGVLHTNKTWTVSVTNTLTFTRDDNLKQLHCVGYKDNSRTDVLFTKTEVLSVHYSPNTSVTPEFTINLVERQSFVLRCLTSSNPEQIHEWKWKHNDNIIVEDSRRKFQGGRLKFVSLDARKDDGTYSCAAKNDRGFGEFGIAFQVTVLFSPRVNITTPKAVSEGESVQLVCSVHSAKPEVTLVKWFHNNRPLAIAGRIKGGTAAKPALRIADVRRNDAGSYVCQLSNDVGSGNSSAVDLEVFYKPYGTAVIKPTIQVVAVLGRIQLYCLLQGDQGHPVGNIYVWTKLNDTSEPQRTTSSQFYVNASTVLASGQYQCAVANSVGTSNRSSFAKVVVETPPTIEHPQSADYTSIAYDDDKALMTCIVSGTSINKLVWMHRDKQTVDDDFVYTSQPVHGQYKYSQTTGTEYKLYRRHQHGCRDITKYGGGYYCLVTGQLLNETRFVKSAAYNISVKYPAFWNASNNKTAAAFGDVNATINCAVCSDPEPRFKWLFNGSAPLRNGVSMHGSRIVIDRVVAEDYGTYTCITTVDVLGREIEKRFNIEFIESGEAGDPSHLSVLSNRTSFALSLWWRAGFDGGHPPQRFTITFKLGSVVTTKRVPDSGEEWLLFTVTGLRPSTVYRFELYAENSRPSGNNRSGVLYAMGATRAAPVVSITNVVVEPKTLLVMWDNMSKTRRKRSPYGDVFVVIYYQKEAEDEVRYPTDGRLNVEDRSATIIGEFEPSAHYVVWMDVFEGDMQLSYQKTEQFVPEEKSSNGSGSGSVIAGAVIGVIVSVCLSVLIVVLIWRRRKLSRKQTGADMTLSNLTDQPKQVEHDGCINTAYEVDKPMANGACAEGEDSEVLYEKVVLAKPPTGANNNNECVPSPQKPVTENNENLNSGVIYAELDFAGQQGSVVRGKATSPVIYKEVDFSKKYRLKNAATADQNGSSPAKDDELKYENLACVRKNATNADMTDQHVTNNTPPLPVKQPRSKAGLNKLVMASTSKPHSHDFTDDVCPPLPAKRC